MKGTRVSSPLDDIGQMRDDIGQMRDDIDKLAQRFEQAHTQLGSVTGQDGSGTVPVTVDKQGLVTDVRVDARWANHHTADTLGPAVSEAIMAAVAARTRQWGELYADERQQQPEPVLRPAPTPADSLAGQLTELAQRRPSGSDEATLDALLEMLTAVNESIDDVSAQVSANLTAEFSGQSSSGHVQATVSGAGSVTDIGYEASWLQRAHAFNISRETTEAVKDAYRRLAGHDAACRARPQR